MNTRTVNVVRRKVEYYKEEVNLLEHLKRNLAEIYLSRENKCVEIRFPTRVGNYTHFVAHVPFSAIKNLDMVWYQIKGEQHMKFLEEYVDDIVWREEWNDTVDV